MIFVTGDCHGNWSRFSTDAFPEQKEMTRDDYVIVCGDFGIWKNDKEERHWLDWLAEKQFTLLFVDGNHENFDRLYSDEFEIVDFHEGKAHQIRGNVFHLMRGYVFDLCGKKIFAFGGASSHDIENGVIGIEDYKSKRAMMDDYKRRRERGEMIRINHISWWHQEIPTEEEMQFGLETLAKNGNKVDFIISHCLPQSIAAVFSMGAYESDRFTDYFDIVAERVQFKKWFAGHYHANEQIFNQYIVLYEQIIRIA